MKKNRGFTLMELMIVVLIVGILGAIAYPSYMESVRKTNRADAKAALNDVAGRMERCFTTNSTYVGCAFLELSGEKYYRISAALATATFTITATPDRKPQTEDTDCPVLTLNNLGERTPDDDICW